MPAPATVADFLDVVKRSNQLDFTAVESYMRTRTGELPRRPRRLAAEMVRAKVMTNFQAEQFLLGKYKGFHIGGYRVIERIGQGGAGTVYLAEHALMKRQVALKVLPTPYADNPVLLGRFKREAKAAAVLDHPNVVKVFDLRQEGSLHFIVMEYIAGPNFQQVIGRRRALPVEVACEYVRQAALGLAHAHAAGLIHRDVKPANILIDATGCVKLLDLGLARFDGEDVESLTQKFNSQCVLGTADYLAPEQAMNLHGVTPAADIYGLGATFYALLTGRPPFDEGSIGQKLLWHQTRVPTPVRELRPDVPDEVSALVAKMLAKSPEGRPANAADIAEALRPWAERARPEAVAPTPSMADLNLDAMQGTTRTTASGRLMPTGEIDTRVMRNEDDTASIEGAGRKAAPPPTSMVFEVPAEVLTPTGGDRRKEWPAWVKNAALVGAGVVLGVGALVLTKWLMG